MITQALVPSACESVSLPELPFMDPVSVAPVPIANVSVPVPPVRFSKPLQPPVAVSLSVPLLAPSMVKALLSLSPISVSASAWPPPATAPASVPALANVTVSSPLPPVTFGKFVNVVVVVPSFTVPSLGPVRVHVFVVFAPTSVEPATSLPVRVSTRVTLVPKVTVMAAVSAE